MSDIYASTYIVVESDHTWREDANCKGVSIEVFMSKTKKEINSAKAYCAGCIVVNECLEYAKGNNMVGVWGGSTENERSTHKRIINEIA
jgi:WhiB family redox-sensing transcriptional regulator